MEQLHAHEVLHMMEGNSYSEITLKEAIINKFGKDQHFYACSTLTAKYSDIDINGHVNSIRYIEHILDLFPIELYKTKHIRRFEMAYVAESYYGDELSFFQEEVNENEYHVEVKKNGNEVVCRSKVLFE